MKCKYTCIKTNIFYIRGNFTKILLHYSCIYYAMHTPLHCHTLALRSWYPPTPQSYFKSIFLNIINYRYFSIFGNMSWKMTGILKLYTANISLTMPKNLKKYYSSRNRGLYRDRHFILRTQPIAKSAHQCKILKTYPDSNGAINTHTKGRPSLLQRIVRMLPKLN